MRFLEEPFQKFWGQTNIFSLFFSLPIFTLKNQLEKKRDDFCKQNMKASSDRCSALLRDLFSPLEEDVKQGIYSKPGGYRLLIQKTQELKEKYLQEPRKGIQVIKIYWLILGSCWHASLKHQCDLCAITGLTAFMLSFNKHIQGACYTRYILCAHPRECILLKIEL